MAFGILFIAVLIVIVILFDLAIDYVWGATYSNGNIVKEKPVKLDCLKFSDGTLAVVEFNSRDGCGIESGAPYTISYLLKKGYHIDAVVPSNSQGNARIDMGTVFMSR